MTSMMPKQLAQFLQEQQEPFILEVYLLERHCYSHKNRLHSSEGSSLNSSTKAKPCLKSSVSCDLKRNQKFIPNYCSKVVRALFSKLLTVKGNQKLDNSEIRLGSNSVSDMDKGRQEVAGVDNFSSASSTTVFNSCSESDVEDAHCSSKNADLLLTIDHRESLKDEYVLPENEVAAGWKFRWRGTEDSRDLSPVSVLEETESYSGSAVGKSSFSGLKLLPLQNLILESNFNTLSICFIWIKFTEDEAGTKQKRLLKSVSKCKAKKPMYKRTQEVQDFTGSNSIVSSHYSKNKKAVQQTRQLLFDCVREVVEKHKKEPGGQQFQGIQGAEHLWELICENLCIWSKESINETNITQLLHSDVLASAQEWSDLEKQTQEIGFQLGDAILEDISNGIITEMIAEMISICGDR